MKRVDLVKYGFVRSPEDDFSDDGNRFTCYRVGKIRVSKLVSDGEVYLSGGEPGSGLPYDVYSKLPHYQDVNWKYNGVALSTLTEDDIQAFYEACVAYEIEYENAVKQTNFPTEEELNDAADKEVRARKAEYEYIAASIANNPEVLITMRHQSTYNFNEFMKYFDCLHRDAHTRRNAAAMWNTSYSFDYVRKDFSHPSFYYEQCKELIAAAK